jgi:hypothetical protein
MKKIVASVMCLTILCASVSALALNSVPFSFTTNGTPQGQTGTVPVTTTSSYWYITISNPNFTPDYRLALRCVKGNNAISATWVYTKPSTTIHPFNAPYNIPPVSDVTLYGILDVRTPGTFTVTGNFYH